MSPKSHTLIACMGHMKCDWKGFWIALLLDTWFGSGLACYYFGKARLSIVQHTPAVAAAHTVYLTSRKNLTSTSSCSCHCFFDVRCSLDQTDRRSGIGVRVGGLKHREVSRIPLSVGLVAPL